MIYYTSDTHFGHKNIIKYSNRPFSSVEEMDEAMITRWNSRVRSIDTVYFLGDFSFMGVSKAEALLRRLNGTIHFIWGNHDSEEIRRSSVWASSQPYLEIHDSGKLVVLLHYGMRVWNKSHHGSLMLYGHSHNSLPGNSQSLDVGVDCWDFTPVTLSQCIERMRTLPDFRPVDHHVSRRT